MLIWFIVYKATHSLLGCSIAELRLQIVLSAMRGAGIRLTQKRAHFKFMSGLCVRVLVQ